jgi:hypothetical protein
VPLINQEEEVNGARVVRIRTLEQLAAWMLFSLAVITVYGILVVM